MANANASRAQVMDDSPTKRSNLGFLVWGLIVALWVSRHFFLLPANCFLKNDGEGTSYLLRQIEFQNCLANGYWSPQWCSSFRSGLGSPYFTFYQPGWFYFTSLFAWSGDVVRQLGMAVVAVSLIGYTAIMRLTATRFGQLGGALAGTFFLTAEYPGTDLYIRCDFSEYAATMLMPLWFLALDQIWFEEQQQRSIRLLPWSTAAIALMHPCVALQVGIVGAFLIAWNFLTNRNLAKLQTTVISLLAGIALAAPYWFSMASEWSLVQPDAAMGGIFQYSQHFVGLWEIFGSQKTRAVTHVKFGELPSAIVLGALMVSLIYWKRLTNTQRRTLLISLALFAAALFFSTKWSSFLWQTVPLLSKLQFPWRFLALAAFAGASISAALCNARLPVGQTVVVIAMTAMLMLSRYSSPKIEPEKIELPPSAQAISQNYFAPDVANEWLPKGADEFANGEPFKKTYTGPGQLVAAFSDGLEIQSANWSAGRISCELSSTNPATLTLRHYFYPVGWRATLNGEPVPLQRSHQGLMQVPIPAKTRGKLQLVFHTTTSRKIGLSIAFVAAALLLLHHWRSNRLGIAESTTGHISKDDVTLSSPNP